MQYFELFLLNNFIAEKRIIKNYHKRNPRKIIGHKEFDFAMSRLNENKEIKILDIGAHHGEFTDLCGTFNRFHNWKIYSVEPLKQNIRHIKKKKYPNVFQSIIPIGISDTSNIKTFTLGTADSLFTCEPEWKVKFPHHFKEPKEIDIQCLSIPDMASKYLSSVETIFDFVKIDVEGHDLNVIISFCN